jgi:hypothetical protein
MALLACAAAMLLPAAASSQYLYLDSNGDGISDGSDVVQAVGPTTINVWLRTDANRDGSPAVCSSEDGPLSINSYEFVLRAINGTIAWGSAFNQIEAFSTDLGLVQSMTEFHMGYAGGSALPPGLYHLATLSFSAASGTPSIEIAASPNSLAGALQTAFGSSCSSLDYDNTLALGTEWFDADGLEYGGAVHFAPVLQTIPDLVVNEGDLLEQALSATDADGDPLTFAKVAGPAFMEVTTLDPGAGSATGRVRLTPGFTDAGLDTGTVSATDGDRSVQARFRIEVRNTNRAPVINPIPDLQVTAGTQTLVNIRGSDPDGSAVHFYKASGPLYLGIFDQFPGTGVNAGLISLTPSLSDGGSAIGVAGLSDGTASSELSFGIRVTVPPVVATIPDLSVQVGGVLQQELHAISGDGEPVTFDKLRGPHFMAVTTIDPGTGLATGRLLLTPSSYDAGTYDAAVRASDGTDEGISTFRISVIDPNGSGQVASLFESAFSSNPVPSGPMGAVVLDANADGKLDVVSISDNFFFWPSVISVFSGRGNGTLQLVQQIESGDIPTSIAAADFDRNGTQDLAVCSNYGPLSVYRGRGDGTFEISAVLAGGGNSYEIHAGDWDGDGWPDLAVVSNSRGLSIFRNRQDGSFDDPIDYATGLYPADLASGDIDEDGDFDMVVSDIRANSVTVYVNDRGAFTKKSELAVGTNTGAVLLQDLTGDGHVDLIVRGGGTWLLAGVGDGTFAAPAALGVTIAVLEDMDGDGTLDAIAPTGPGILQIWPGLGGGLFDAPHAACTGKNVRQVLIADLNSDGNQDLILPDDEGKQLCIALGRGGGQFSLPKTAPIPTSAVAAASGDWNGDGLVDAALILSNPAGLSILLGDANEVLRTGPHDSTGPVPSAIVSADLDRDGRADLLLADWSEPALRWYRGNGLGAFDPAVLIPVSRGVDGVAVGDFNGDGLLDAAASASDNPLDANETKGILILLGRGDGTFLPPTTWAPLTIAHHPTVGDFDGDGHQDVAYFGRSWMSGGILWTLWGQGDGTFVTDEGRSMIAAEGEAAAADPDHDGVSDLFASLPDSSAVVRYHADASRSWRDGDRYDTGVGGSSFELTDVNQDGALDLAVSNAGGNTVSFFAGNPDGSFGSRTDFGTGLPASLLLLGDVTGDRKQDVVALTSDGRCTVLRNLGSATANEPPVAEAGGPYACTAGIPLVLDGTASHDPDGDVLRYEWNFGDGAIATSAAPSHTYSHGGVYKARLVVDDGRMQGSDSAQVEVAEYLSARAFRKTPSPVVIGAGPPTLTVAIEPVGSAFTIDEIDPRATWMIWTGAVPPDSIAAEPSKGIASSDLDQNGISEMQIPFSREGLARLFDGVTGRQSVVATLSGVLLSGARFRATLPLTLIHNPGGIDAAVFPNPLNPRAVLSFSVGRAGVVRIDLFDAAGRRVRTVLPPRYLSSGTHDVELDGSDGRGHRLGTGVYFYRISSGEKTATGRVVIVK